MMYRWITTGELIDEIEDYSQHITKLALQMEKLVKLRSEGKISDMIYAEFHQSICRDIESLRVERQDLIEAANARVKEVGSEVNELKYRLERLEVRHMLDLISDDTYTTAKGELKKKIAEGDETLLLIGKLNSSIEDAHREVDGYINIEKRQPVVQIPSTRLEDVFREAPKLIGPFTQEHISDKPEVPLDDIPMTQRKIVQRIDENGTMEGNKTIKESKEPLNNGGRLSKNTIKCPRCGMENLSIAAYCFKCRTMLSDAQKLWSRP